MKKVLLCLLITTLFLSLAAVAIAEAPEPGSLSLVQQIINRNASWTPESYPEIWITPFYAEYIIEERDAERYPANFLRFAPPEGAASLRIDSDYASFVDFDTYLQYSYQAMDRASYELFLEKAEEENILADGSGGVAMYVSPGHWGRARAMLDLKAYFGGTAKLYIELYDGAGEDLTAEKLSEMIQAEAARVQASLQFEELDRFWSQGVFATVELSDGTVTIAVDTAAMTLTDIQTKKLKSRAVVDSKVRATEIEISSPYQDDLEEAEFADGTPYLCKVSEYWSDAYFYIQERRAGDPIYLHIKIEGTFSLEAFAAELEKVYALVTLPEAE